MQYCEACGKEEGLYHVTVTVDVFGPESTKQKRTQFWLGDTCIAAINQVMARDPQQQQRVAWRMTQDPQLFSKFKDARERRYARSPARPVSS